MLAVLSFHTILMITFILVYVLGGSSLKLFGDFLIEYFLIVLCTISTHAYFPIVFKKKRKVSDSATTDSVTDDPKGSQSYTLIFQDPITRSYLRVYMAKMLQDESIIFWETINELEDIERNLNEEKKEEYCQLIYDRFIKDGSEMEININSSMKNKITQKLKKNV